MNNVVRWCSKQKCMSNFCFLWYLEQVFFICLAQLYGVPISMKTNGSEPYSGVALNNRYFTSRGSLRDVVYLGWPIAPSHMSPNAGGGGLRGLSQCVQLCTWSANKLWRSNSIFNPIITTIPRKARLFFKAIRPQSSFSCRSRKLKEVA